MKREIIKNIESAKTETDLLAIRRQIGEAQKVLTDNDVKELFNKLAIKSKKLINPKPLEPRNNFTNIF